VVTDDGIQLVSIGKRHDSLGTMSSSQYPVVGDDGAATEEGIAAGLQVASPWEFVHSRHLPSDNPAISGPAVAIARSTSCCRNGSCGSAGLFSGHGNLAFEGIRIPVVRTGIAVVALEDDGQAVGGRGSSL